MVIERLSLKILDKIWRIYTENKFKTPVDEEPNFKSDGPMTWGKYWGWDDEIDRKEVGYREAPM